MTNSMGVLAAAAANGGPAMTGMIPIVTEVIDPGTAGEEVLPLERLPVRGQRKKSMGSSGMPCTTSGASSAHSMLA